MQKRAGFLLAAVALIVLAGCGANKPSNTEAQPTQQQGGSQANGFAALDASARSLVAADAVWHAPESLTVDQTDRIGLSIGSVDQGTTLKNKIDTLVKDGKATSAGTVQVGPTVRATLRTNPADAQITPSEAVNVSTGSDIQMLWTWLVHPKRPMEALQLTVFLEVPLDNGHIISNEIGFRILVKRTLMYTAAEVAGHWGTWSAIVATLVSVIGWFIRRRNRRKAGKSGGSGGPQATEPSTAPAPAAAA